MKKKDIILPLILLVQNKKTPFFIAVNKSPYFKNHNEDGSTPVAHCLQVQVSCTRGLRIPGQFISTNKCMKDYNQSVIKA